jgi:CDGSH-type Zn-finger protein
MDKNIAEFHIIPGGPLRVTGHFRLTDGTGKKLETQEEVFLCRCGGSATKPFCDGTHKKNGFKG